MLYCIKTQFLISHSVSMEPAASKTPPLRPARASDRSRQLADFCAAAQSFHALYVPYSALSFLPW